MTAPAEERWRHMQTDETRQVEKVLRKKFGQVDAYRFNSASIRVRVIDERFKGKSTEQRDRMVEPLLKELPASTQADIINLLTLAPDELEVSTEIVGKAFRNLEFEDPRPSML